MLYKKKEIIDVTFRKLSFTRT